MDDWTAERKLREAGLTYTEAFWIMDYLRDERVTPSSRTKATKLARLEQLLRDSGIEPAELTFHGVDRE